MKIKKFLMEFMILFIVTFVVNAIVIYVCNLIRYGEGAFNWGLSFGLAVAVGIALPLAHALDKWIR